MPVTRITSLGGRILSVSRDGVISNLVPDPQGNTVALRDSTGAITDTFSYWPYGAERTHVGASSTPFRYGGIRGCYRDAGSRLYVRARNASTDSARWLTLDPDSVRSMAVQNYKFAASNPVTYVDPSGLRYIGDDERRGWRPPRVGPLPRFSLNPWNPWCVEQQREIGSSLTGPRSPLVDLPGSVGGPKDALRHCTISCRVIRVCGMEAYRRGVLEHESGYAWWAKGSWDPVHGPMDLINDGHGLTCSGRPGSCIDECRRLYLKGTLAWYPREMWHPRKPEKQYPEVGPPTM